MRELTTNKNFITLSIHQSTLTPCNLTQTTKHLKQPSSHAITSSSIPPAIRTMTVCLNGESLLITFRNQSTRETRFERPVVSMLSMSQSAKVAVKFSTQSQPVILRSSSNLPITNKFLIRVKLVPVKYTNFSHRASKQTLQVCLDANVPIITLLLLNLLIHLTNQSRATENRSSKNTSKNYLQSHQPP